MFAAGQGTHDGMSRGKDGAGDVVGGRIAHECCRRASPSGLLTLVVHSRPQENADFLAKLSKALESGDASELSGGLLVKDGILLDKDFLAGEPV